MRGAEAANNPTEDATSGPCPIGHFCPSGTAYPLGCVAGTYSPNTGLSVCLDCIEGYYCLENATEYNTNPCITGHYCPTGTGVPDSNPCVVGTYNDVTGSSNQFKLILDI